MDSTVLSKRRMKTLRASKTLMVYVCCYLGRYWTSRIRQQWDNVRWVDGRVMSRQWWQSTKGNGDGGKRGEKQNR